MQCQLSFGVRAGSLKDDRSLPVGSKLVFVEREMGQTNEQQRHFNKWPISELLGEVDYIQTSLNYFLLSSNNGMSSLSFSSGKSSNLLSCSMFTMNLGKKLVSFAGIQESGTSDYGVSAVIYIEILRKYGT
jgi:hypothetical protein